MQELGENGGVGEGDLAVKRVDSSNMESLGSQQTRNQINIAWPVASWWNVEGKLCDYFICSMVSGATWNTNSEDSPSTSTGSLSMGASPGRYDFSTWISAGS